MTDEQTQDNPTPPEASDAPPADAPGQPAAPGGEEHAKISSGYRMRIGLMALMLIGWAAYCYYDAFHGFPRHDDLVQRVTPKLDEYKTKFGADRNQWIEKWDAELYEPSLAESVPPDQKWPAAADAEKLVAKGEHTQFTYWFNYVMLVASAPFGVMYLVGYFRAGRRWIHMDATGFTTHNGKNAPFDKITKLNKERWRNKGIAVVYYTAQDGRERPLVLDDWKFEREPIERMLLTVQSRLSKDQIIGDQAPLAELVDPDEAEHAEAGEGASVDDSAASKAQA